MTVIWVNFLKNLNIIAYILKIFFLDLFLPYSFYVFFYFYIEALFTFLSFLKNILLLFNYSYLHFYLLTFINLLYLKDSSSYEGMSVVPCLWTRKNWRLRNVDLEKSWASLLPAGSRSTIPQTEKRKKKNQILSFELNTSHLSSILKKSIKNKIKDSFV